VLNASYKQKCTEPYTAGIKCQVVTKQATKTRRAIIKLKNLLSDIDIYNIVGLTVYLQTRTHHKTDVL